MRRASFFRDFLSRHDLFTEKMIDEVGLNLKTFAQKSEMIDLADLLIWSWDINLLLSKIENTSRACMFLKTVPGSRVLLPICGSRESIAYWWMSALFDLRKRTNFEMDLSFSPAIRVDMEAVFRKDDSSKIIADEEANIFPRKKKFVTSWS